MRLSTAFQFCTCVLLAALINWQWRFASSDPADTVTYALELRATPSHTTHVQVYYDDGSGYSEPRSSRATLPEANHLQTARIALPRGTYRSLRIDPLEGEGSVNIEWIRLVDSRGQVVTTFSQKDFRPKHHIASFRPQGSHGFVLVSTPGDADPQIETTATAIEVPPESLGDLLARLHLGRCALIALILFLVLLALDRIGPVTRAIQWLWRRAEARSRTAIAVAGALAVVASAYPVVFLGESFVSPNGGTTLLYGGFPTLPGYSDDRVLNTQGSDVGAIIWQHVPYAAIQRRALAGGELPLWNRYTSGGTPLLAQGQSMFGDPLHWLPIAFDSAAWAWDLKYLLAKLLLAFGLGLCVWTLTAALPASLVVAIASPFVGFFIYRQNHPAIFSFCYAPWIVLGWLALVQAADRRQRALGAALLFVANASTLTSGTVKEAYALLLGLNACGLAVLFFDGRPLRSRMISLGWAGAGIALSVGATMPVWATFFHTLRNAYTTYDRPVAYQIQPALLLGAFDEAFYRLLSAHRFVYNPALNLLLGFGLLYSIASPASTLRQRSARSLALGSLVPLALVYGVVPAAWIVQIPLLRNIWHIDNSFGCVLLILWSVLAGVGFAKFFQDIANSGWQRPAMRVAAMFAGIIAVWAAFFQASSKPALDMATYSPALAVTIPTSLWLYLLSLLAALALWVWGNRLLQRQPATLGLICALFFTLVPLLWRQGQHSTRLGAPEAYLAQPTVRTDFHASSRSIARLQAAQTELPSRIVGVDGVFFPGWGAIYGLESPGGVDALSNRFFVELTAQFPDWAVPAPADREKLERLRPLFDLLNIRFYLAAKTHEAAIPPHLEKIARDDLDAYRSASAWPRAFFTDRLGRPGDLAEFVTALRQGDGRPFAAAEAPELQRVPSLIGISTDLATRTVIGASEYRQRENGAEFSIQASGRGVVVIHDTYWPDDIHATLNERPAPAFRANHAFRGIEIPAAGSYRVRFEYAPARFSLYSAISAASIIGALGFFSAAIFRQARPTSSENQ